MFTMQKGNQGKSCEICSEIIKDKKSYRQVKSNVDFCQLFLELNLEEDGYVCKFCVNKLNRLVRIDDDIKTKVAKLTEKRNELLAELKNAVGSKVLTPVIKKRGRQKNTPTPRKLKVRRLLSFPNSPGASDVRDPADSIKPLRDESAGERSQQAADVLDEQIQPLVVDSVQPDSQTKLYHEKDFDVKMRGVTQEQVTVQFNASANQNSNPRIIYSSGNQGKVVSFLKEKIRKTKENPSPPIEILGDNVDILVSPANMTLDRQRKSWHWFLLLATQKRITDKDLPTDESLADVETIDSCEFVPSEDEIEEYQKNTQFHVAKILTKYIEELRQFERLLPNNIQHPYIEKTSQKSVFINCDLIDESENSSDGMIRILQRVHSLAVPYINENIEKVVLGGDVLTNERALSAQQAMRNNETCDEKLLGVIHRPEGLHRQMNFLMVTFHHWNLLFLVYFILR
ncbi:uncharacterized protein LOC125674871 [Ostrea edulis]|uniref:uncharacterized protein LOC125674871 n=1 Tax=Ostrea edulis TaxID=37623 RepID=UPI0024AEF1DE|nr:uncharacterized protein LOC125674871 [Ostrea edulis]